MAGALTRMLGRMPSGPSEPAWSGAPGFIGNGAFTNTTADLSLDVPYPASISYHDILILHVIGYEATSGAPTINTPAGWTQIDQQNMGGTSLNICASFWKRADGTETGSVTVTFAGTLAGATDAKVGIMSNYRGCLATGTPYEALASNTANGTNPTGSAVTTTGADRQVIDLIAKSQSNAASDCTPAAGWTERYEGNATSPRAVALALHDKTVASASTEPAEATTNLSCRWVVTSLALLPR